MQHSDEHFSQPPMRQVAKAGYADKAFVGEVVKYGEMVQVSQCSRIQPLHGM